MKDAIQLNGYQIAEKIYSSSKTLVYRGSRNCDQQSAIIKLMRNEYPTFDELVQFRNQYAITKNLELPGVVRPLTLENYGNGLALIMPDDGCISISNYISNNLLNIGEFLEIGIQIAKILEALYQNRVIHKDIKPQNILIHPETKKVKLIDFSIASLLPREQQEIANPNILEGTLAYISPEQTGRMNRGVDYRTDFYSLGATFYELLTGKLPFDSVEAMELVHCHIAQKPTPPRVVNPAVPGMLNEIIMKLMAKTPEERYQSASGLRFDLEKCWRQWQENHCIAEFKLAERDISDRFSIPEKLYGRQQEVSALLVAFDAVSDGATEMILVAGFSGIGKTAVVNEVQKPIVRQRGYFIKGKFDQFKRNIPLSAIVQGFRDLIRQLLSESDAQIAEWKRKILSALGDNAGVILEVIPELEKIVGIQPPVTELSGSAAQNRFNLLFQKFTKIFTSKEHPLTIFIDDLQWADSASLQFIKLLMQEDAGYLLLIGAYRDNEVSPAHPLMLTLKEISQATAAVDTITLAPLKLTDLNNLIAGTLSCSGELALPLTKLVFQKTKGNPFFANQFLKGLHDDGLISFDFNLGHWQCDMVRTMELALTDDVVEFMASRLKRLPEATQDVLKFAACIGNQFDLATLAIASNKSQTETATELWKALQEGLILPQSQIYKFFTGYKSKKEENLPQTVTYNFLHDRVQQAAYFSIDEERKKQTHLKIGLRLLRNTSPEELEGKIFDLVNQLNRGIESANEKEKIDGEELARLNLIAGKKAKASAAYQAALEYLNFGVELLGEKSWESGYELTLSLYEEAAEAAYLNGEFETMERLVATALKQAKSLLDCLQLYEAKIQSAIAQNKHHQAIKFTLDLCESLGVKIPEKSNNFKIFSGLIKTKIALSRKQLQDLLDLPTMEDPYKLAVMRLLTGIVSAAYHSAPELLPLIVFKKIELSLKYGNTSFSAVAYALYGLILCGMVEDIEVGYEFGKLAFDLIERFDAKELKTRVYFILSCDVIHWKDHLQNSVDLFKSAYQSGWESGDLEFTALCQHFTYYSYFMGKDLAILEPEIKQCSQDAIAKLHQEAIFYHNELYRQAILNLQGYAENPCLLIGEAYNEEKMLPLHQQVNNRYTIVTVYFHKLMLCYLFGDFPQALKNADLVREYLDGMVGIASVPVFYLYDSLARLAVFEDANKSEKQHILALVKENQKKMSKWAKNAPMNCSHKFYLVEAEINRVGGRDLEAMNGYDRAISLAQENEYINEEALANELAAKFYIHRGKEKIAQTYAIAAYYCYARWGAKAKLDALEEAYPQLLRPIFEQQAIDISPRKTISTTISTSVSASRAGKTRVSSTTNVSNALDLVSVIKAARSVSSEIELDRLLLTLMEVVMENAGASKGALMLMREGTLVIEAIATKQTSDTPIASTVLQSISVEDSQEIPISLVNYVKRTLETVVVDYIRDETKFVADPYLTREKPMSFLCLPISDRGKQLGILYLENNLTVRAFTTSRLEVIELLISQAAISLENAWLYQNLQQSELREKEKAIQLEKSLQELQQAQLQLVQSEKMSALGQLVAGVAHEINNPLGFIEGNLSYASEYVQSLINHLRLYQEKFPEPGNEIEQRAEKVELEYIIEDLPQLIVSMKEGSDRIREISTSLRSFSRTDTEKKVAVNIHEGIDSTLLILKHRLKANQERRGIKVIKEYGELPLVTCYPGLLNQVFMNLISNAIDIFDESNREGVNNGDIITIRTEFLSESERVVIRIKDNGQGMSPEVKQRIFDHLFTTKPVGKGTGLGLSISRQIVEEKHGGRLSCDSALGMGTEFAIEIPME